MSNDVTNALERRRQRRRTSFWRGLAIAFAVLTILVLGARGLVEVGGLGGQQIARVEVSGLITNDRKTLKLLEDLKKDKSVAAVILAVDSPGGTTTGGEALYQKIREISGEKPVVAVFGTVAASAAYIVGLASDRIVARGNTITGSVGVIFQWAEVTGLLDNIGVKMNEVKSGPLKAEPSMFGPMSDEARAVTEEMVQDAQDWFNGLVAERRALVLADVPGLTQGRIYSGRQALDLKLIDEIGGEAEAIKWLESSRDVPANLPVRDRKPRNPDDLPLFQALAVWIAGAFGVDLHSGLSVLGFGERAQALQLDGLVSVWHPSLNSPGRTTTSP